MTPPPPNPADDAVAGATAAAVLIGISGVSSSGKTTISRLLRDLFPSTFILHQDDFYKPESELPFTEGFRDWDCADAISVPAMDAALAHVRAHGTLPPDLKSIEDQNSVGSVPISDSVIETQRARVQTWLHETKPPLTPSSSSSSTATSPPPLRICIVDGFLLYTPSLDAVTRHLHARLFLLATRAAAVARRAGRDGYVTLDGFWADPPGYVERVVWPGYVAAHRWLFEQGDVDAGRLDCDVLATACIEVADCQGAGADQGAGGGLDSVLEWAVGRVMAAVDEFVASRSSGSG